MDIPASKIPEEQKAYYVIHAGIQPAELARHSNSSFVEEFNEHHCYGFGNIFLSKRELSCLRLISDGLTYREIAASLSLAISTIESYVDNLKNKLNAHNRQDLCMHYQRFKIIDSEIDTLAS